MITIKEINSEGFGERKATLELHYEDIMNIVNALYKYNKTDKKVIYTYFYMAQIKDILKHGIVREDTCKILNMENKE